MNKFILTLFLAILFMGCKQEPLSEIAAQTFHYNHQIVEEHKLAPRASFFNFESPDISEKENSNRFLSLNGNWKFNWVKDPKQRPTTFQNIDFLGPGWGEVFIFI